MAPGAPALRSLAKLMLYTGTFTAGYLAYASTSSVWARLGAVSRGLSNARRVVPVRNIGMNYRRNAFFQRLSHGVATYRTQQSLMIPQSLRGGERSLCATAASIVEPSVGPQLGEAGTAKAIIRDVFQRAIDAAYPGLGVDAELVRCQDPKFGDYQLNNAMQLFGKLKKAGTAPKSPRQVAEAILGSLPDNVLLGDTSIAGPGFINVRVTKSWLQSQLKTLLDQGIRAWAPRVDKRVVVDFSSPNVAKEMHVGHLRSTIIGDTICKTLELCGADVVRLNHVGDWGTQFGMLIEHMRSEGISSNAQAIGDLQELYRGAKKRFDEDEDFKGRAREAVKILQSGDEESLTAWRKICDASRHEFQAIYDRLNVSLTERGESFYNPMLDGISDKLQQEGVAKVSDGALCVFVNDGDEVPLMLRKSDGGYGYASTDMAAIRHRINEERADWIVYVTDAGQKGHFDLVFGAAKKAGWLDKEIRLDHVGFGLVLGEDGKRFRTRSGDLVRLVELLDEAKARCAETIKERRPDIDDNELDSASSAMGYGAVKYADLKNNRLSNYKFSYDQMLSLQGDTAVYLMYAFARIAGILRKSGVDMKDIQDASIHLEEPREIALALKLTQFPEAINDTLDSLMPNRLTEYLYDLTEIFNQFYNECKVVGSASQDSRLLLVQATAKVMRQCFGLLGITPLNRL
ncbi:hypothetical protein AAMO2058_000659300 [Amorphochlora amoebiformis]